MRRKKGKHWSVGSEFGHERFESFLLRCCTRCCFHLSLVPFLSSFIPRCSRYSTLPHGRQVANGSSPLLISCINFRCMHRFVGFMFDARMDLLLVLSRWSKISCRSLYPRFASVHSPRYQFLAIQAVPSLSQHRRLRASSVALKMMDLSSSTSQEKCRLPLFRSSDAVFTTV